MFSTSSISLLSITNFDNGDTNNINQNTTVCDTSKPPSLPPLGRSRGSHSCHLTKKAGSTYAEAMKFGMGCSPNSINNSTELRVSSALPSFSPIWPPLTEHMKELKALCLLGKAWRNYVPLLAIINKTKVDWKFVTGHISYLILNNNWISIKFANVEDKEMVWRERPWYVNGLNFVLSPWLQFFLSLPYLY